MRAGLLLLVLTSCLPVSAREPIELEAARLESAAQFEELVQPFLQQFCVDCHSEDEPEAELSLQFERQPQVSQRFDQWTVILQKVAGEEMPPEDAAQPSDKERAAFVNWIGPQLESVDCATQKVKPRVTVRRLNRFEYDNVIADLFGLAVRPAEEFPADDVGEGFDNIGEVLSMPPLLMEKYLDAAEQVTDGLSKNDEAWLSTFGFHLAEQVDRVRARVSISRLASRAFRRPATDDQVDRLMQIYDFAGEQGVGQTAAFQLVTQAILVSPRFLFRLEEDPLADPANPQPLDSYAIASRLSFFLWSSLPDDELNRLADQDELRTAEVIGQQARRMLLDPRADKFVTSFVGQWLELRLLQKAAPDPELFPSFDDSLRSAMAEETLRFFRDLIHSDASILNLLDSDYTFVNERLARHYGLDGIEGDGFRRVQLTSGRRGGVLTHASILTLTSNPTRTSPVKRGKWILENVLGTPPPPPPPNVPELEDGENELLGSLRERMEQHRENPSCAVCHRKMDVLGFGFENFDGIGAWREKDGRYPIDAAGQLPGNKTFDNPAELRQILVADSREFTSCLTRKLLTYALGRALSSRDRCVVDDIVQVVETNDHRFSSLIVAIVTSETFRYSGESGAKR